MNDDTEQFPPASRSRAQQEVNAAASAASGEARLAHEKLAKLHHENNGDPAGPVDGIRRS